MICKIMNEQISRESVVHGTRWNSVHEGYFSDPAIAAPLIQKTLEWSRKAEAEAIVDLGGGTGYLLSQLQAHGIDPAVSLIDLDHSPAQLDVARQNGFSCIHGSVDSFSRRDTIPEKSCLYMMRSVLHYFGKTGLCPVLRHLHGQTKPGEIFVHQTASFRHQKEADCLNELYRMMRTPKWYPTVDVLCDFMLAEGWQVLEILPALPLRLRDDDLMQRYQLQQADIQHIRAHLSPSPHVPSDVFQPTADGFCAFLHYWIYVCTPAIKAT